MGHQKTERICENIVDTDAGAIIHLAGFSKDSLFFPEVREIDDLNHHETERLAQIAKRHGAKFIFASSAALYFDYTGSLKEKN